MLSTTLQLHLQRRVILTRSDTGCVLGLAGRARLTIRSPGPGMTAVLAALAGRSARPLDSYLAIAEAAEPQVDQARIHYLLLRLEQGGLLALSLCDAGRTLATLEPMTAHWRRLPIDPSARWRLSRFAALQRQDSALVLESPLGHARLRVHAPEVAGMIALLASPQAVADLAALLPDAAADTVPALLMLLASARAVFPCDCGGAIAEDGDPDLRAWDAHDLLFHSRSRMGRHDQPYGATFHLAAVQPQPPAIRPPSGAPRIALPRSAPATPGPAFFAVVEARRSIRDPGDAPLRPDQLAALLWSVAGVRQHWPANPDNPVQYAATLRPVAAGGAIHELDLYLTVTRCAGIDPGLYRYDPAAHALEWVRCADATTRRLIDDAMQAAGLTRPPDVLITLAARFARIGWKYQGLAYAAILKHVGAVYQQLYLVATALELAPCALGGGNTEHFAAAAGLDAHVEGSVGEFLISARPAAGRPSDGGSG
jgi:oxazoline/thiazoline dehydrogenase